MAWGTYESKKNASPDGLAGFQINPIDVNFTSKMFGKFGQKFSWQNPIQKVQGDKSKEHKQEAHCAQKGARC